MWHWQKHSAISSGIVIKSILSERVTCKLHFLLLLMDTSDFFVPSSYYKWLISSEISCAGGKYIPLEFRPAYPTSMQELLMCHHYISVWKGKWHILDKCSQRILVANLNNEWPLPSCLWDGTIADALSPFRSLTSNCFSGSCGILTMGPQNLVASFCSVFIVTESPDVFAFSCLSWVQRF